MPGFVSVRRLLPARLTVTSSLVLGAVAPTLAAVLLLVAPVVAPQFAPRAAAATCDTTWVGSSGNWSDPVNWDGGIPDSSMAVCFPADTYQVIVDVPVAVGQLEIGQSSMTGPTLVFNEDVSVAGGIVNYGDINLHGTGAGIAVGPGGLHNAGTLDVDAGPFGVIQGHVINDGLLRSFSNLLVSGPAYDGQVENRGTLTVMPGSTLQIAGCGLAQYGTMSVSGDLVVSNGVVDQRGGEVSNSGAIELYAADLEIDEGVFTGNPIALEAGSSLNTITFGGTGFAAGFTVDVKADRTIAGTIPPTASVNLIAMAPTTTLQGMGFVTNRGSLTLTSAWSGAQPILAGGAGFTNDGLFRTTGLEPAIITTPFVNNAVMTLYAPTTFTPAASVINMGAVSAGTVSFGVTGARATWSQQSGSFTADAVTGDVDWAQWGGDVTIGTATLDGTVTMNGGTFGDGVLRMRSGMVGCYGSCIASDVILENATLHLEPGVGGDLHVVVQGAATLQGNVPTGALFEIAPAGGPASLTVGSPFVNDGLIELESSAAAGTASLLSPGGAIVNRGALFSRGDAQATIDSSSLTNEGTIIVATQTAVGDVTNWNAVVVDPSAELDVAGTYRQNAGITSIVDSTLKPAADVAIAGGTLSGSGTIDGNLMNAGTVHSDGLSVTGTYAQSNDGTLAIDIDGTSAGSFDTFSVTGSAALAGTLALNVAYTPAAGDTFPYLTYASHLGQFGGLTGNVPAVGVRLDASYADAAASLVTVTVPGAPTVTAAPGEGSALVSWTAAAPNGMPVFEYDVTADPGGSTCSTGGALSCTMDGLTPGTAYRFTVVARNDVGFGPASDPSNEVIVRGPAVGFQVSYPDTVTAGSNGFTIVSALDVFGNVALGYAGTAHMTSSDPLAVLPADLVFGSADAGTRTFLTVLKTTGWRSITATDTLTSSITGTSRRIEVTPNVATHFTVAGFPSPFMAGHSAEALVTARDAYENVATGYRGIVHVTTSDPQAVLPADFAFGDSTPGTAQITASLRTAGAQSITVTDTTANSITGTQSAIQVYAAAATHFDVAGATSIAAGTIGAVTVTARDAFDNVATGYTGTVMMTCSDTAGVPPPQRTFEPADAGVATLYITFHTAGTRSITVTDTVESSITGSQTGIAVVPGPATSFVLSPFPSPTVAGVHASVTLTVYDAFDNLATNYAGTVRFTSSDPHPELPANYVFTDADAGVHVFDLALGTAGTQRIRVGDIAVASVAAVQVDIVVVPATATHFHVAGLTYPRVAGTAGTLVVSARDAYDNIDPTYTGTVHFTSSDDQATLPADYTFTGADAGVRSFDVTLRTAAQQHRIRARDTLGDTITGLQTGIEVTPATATHFHVTGLETPRTAGVAGTITVTARDAFENVATGYTGSVAFTSNDPAAALPANYKFVAGDGGTHTFSVTLRTAGTEERVRVTDTVASSVTGARTGIDVNPAATSHFRVTGLATSRTAGDEGTITVTALDAFGNVTPAYTGRVHVTSSDRQAVLPADYTFTGADHGIHAFNVTLKTSGTQTLVVTDTATSSIMGAHASLHVLAGATVAFEVSGLETPRTAGVTGTVKVRAIDAFGNTTVGYRGRIHFTCSDTAASLPADYTFRSTDAGIHTFSVTLRTPGNQRIRATDTAKSSITGLEIRIMVQPAP